MLDGAAKISPMFSEAKRLGMPAVGMTDHGNMFGASEFYRSAVENDLKPIIGIEAYVAPESRQNMQRVRWGTPEQKSDDVSGSGAYTHMTMLAENAEGLRNLFVLSSRASLEGQLGKWARMDAEIVAEHARGIIATTGCPSGEVQTRLRLGQDAKALEAAAKWQDILGRDNFYLELMDHGLIIERRVRDGLLEIGRKLSLPPVVTNDCHYVQQSDAQNHEALLCIQTGKTLTDPSRFRFDGDGYYLKSPAEMREKWDSVVPAACDATLEIAERIGSYAEVFKHRDRMPTFPVPAGETQDTWLEKQVWSGLDDRFSGSEIPRKYAERVVYELDVINKMGFPAYFLVVADLVKHARHSGIRVGPGRGSAAGSLVAWALRITNIDPIPHGLLFERFLNPERVSMPDIDIDFDDRRRGEMVKYATERWGDDKVAQVITFGTIKTKAAIKDASRVQFGQPGYAIADKITKALPPPVAAKDIPLHGITDATHERYSEAVEIRELIERDPDVQRIYETAVGLEGLVRNAGVHACAVIMSSEPLAGIVPLWKRPNDGAIITGFDYPSCENIGLLKMDFLGLRNLTVIGDAIANIKVNRGIEVDLDDLPLDDAPTYEMLARGDNLGVFQLDSAGMRELLLRMAPTEFDDLIASNALYRPGPMAVGAHWSYADRKNGKEPVTPIHPELERPLAQILEPTYGLIVYQEQIMQIAQKVAGYSLGQADLLRRAMGKKKKSILDEAYDGFASGMSSNGYSQAAVTALWDTVLPFAGYAYNKSHAAGYSVIMYWTAYLKANYPAEYMAGLLTSVADDKDKSAVYLAACRTRGITVLPPDVNQSERNFAAVGQDIRFGLGAVRNVGTSPVTSILNTRSRVGQFESFSDYLEQIDLTACTKKVTDALIKAGGFDSFSHPRKGLHLIHANAVDQANSTKKSQALGQHDLFEDTAEAGSLNIGSKIPDEEWPKKEKLALERDMLGLYVSGHPLDGIAKTLDSYTDTKITAILDGKISHGRKVKIAGIISSVDRRVNKNGEPWAIVEIADLEASIEVLFFASSYRASYDALVPDKVCIVTATINIRDDRRSVFANGCSELELRATSNDEPPVVLSLAVEQCTTQVVMNLRKVLQNHPGSSEVHVDLTGPNATTSLAAASELSVEASPALFGDLRALLGDDSVRRRGE